MLLCAFQGGGNNGQLSYNYLNGPGPQVPTLGMSASPALALLIPAPGQQQIFCAHQGCGNNGQLAINVFDFSHWSGDCQILSVGLTDSPALAVFPDLYGLLYCAHQGPGEDGQLWYTTFDGKTWAPDQQVRDPDGRGVEMSASPALAVFNGKLYCAYQGPGNNGQLRYTTFDGKTWAPDQQVRGPDGRGVGMSASPALAWFQFPLFQLPGLLYCAHQGYGNNGQLWYTTFDGRTWAPDQQVRGPDGRGVGMSASPTLAEDGNLLCCAHQGYGDDGLLWYTTFDGKTWAPDQLVAGFGISESPNLCHYEIALT